jgi:predicted ATPase
MKKIYAHNDMFIEIVNEAFKRTNKTVDTTKSKLQFKIGDELLESNKRLSSGEKQFIIVMLAILLQRNQESILIMDDPEISMHLDWQRNLINNILITLFYSKRRNALRLLEIILFCRFGIDGGSGAPSSQVDNGTGVEVLAVQRGLKGFER